MSPLTLLVAGGFGFVLMGFMMWLVWSFSKVLNKNKALSSAQDVYDKAQKKILDRQADLRDKLIESRDSVRDYLRTREVPETTDAVPVFRLDDPVADSSKKGRASPKRKRKRNLSGR